MNPLSAAYAAIARARRRRYDRDPGIRRRLRQPVVSVGNLSVGGSGKTPTVAHLARLLLDEGERPAILTRGYHRREPTDGVLVVSDGRRICADLPRAGDEPLMLARALPGVAVLVGADRYLSGLLAEHRLGRTVHLLDDGFQHVRLHRDIDIVLMAQEDLEDRVLPMGRLREDVSALGHADALVWTGAADSEPRFEVTAQVFRARASIRASRPEGRNLRDDRPGGWGRFQASARNDKLFAVAGLARPRRFLDMLAASGYALAGQMTFPDHHWYTPADVERLVAAARDSNAAAIVTTEKDLVRLLQYRPFRMPIVAAPLDLAVEPAAEFRAWLVSRLDAIRASGRLEQPA